MPPVKGKRTSPTPTSHGKTVSQPGKNGQPADQTGGPPPAPRAKKGPDRPVVYPEPVVKEYRVFPDADHSMTVEDAKDVLGWEEETDDVKFGRECEECLTALVGRKVRMVHNVHNRPIDVQWLLTLRQEHLNRRFVLNWDTIVVSKTRQVNQGQHRLISLILAEYERLRDLRQDGHWKKNWPGPVTMQTLVVFGAEDEDATFMTYNCVRAMSYADVLFRSDLLARFEPHKRRTVAKVVEFAIKVLWDRTGLRNDAYTPRRTHAESDRFLTSHLRLLRAAEHLYEETVDSPVARNNLGVGLGTAAGLLYLFATSDTDPRAWQDAREPSEDLLDLSNWNKAEEFFSLLVGSSPDLRGVRQVIGEVADPNTGADSPAEYAAVLCKAWNTFRDGSAVKPVDCRLEYTRDEDNDLIPTEASRGVPVGGIDLGPGGGGKKKTEDDHTSPAEPVKKPVPTPAQQAAEKKARETDRKDLTDGAKELLGKLREDHAGKVLLFRIRTGTGWQAYEQDAKILEGLCGLVPVNNGVKYVSFATSRCDGIVSTLQAAGHRVAAVWPGEGDTPAEVKDYEAPVPAANGRETKPAPKPRKVPVKK